MKFIMLMYTQYNKSAAIVVYTMIFCHKDRVLVPFFTKFTAIAEKHTASGKSAQKRTGWYEKADLKSNLKIASTIREVPHPGQLSPVTTLNTHGILTPRVFIIT